MSSSSGPSRHLVVAAVLVGVAAATVAWLLVSRMPRGEPRGGLGPSVAVPSPTVPAALAGQPQATAVVGDQVLRVVIAQDHARGLMGIEDLGSLDGMLFVLPETRHPDGGGWWMRDVPIPLEIAFFDPEARLIEIQRMEPCTADPCPIYHASAPYRWALETEVGTLRARPGDRLTVEPAGAVVRTDVRMRLVA